MLRGCKRPGRRMACSKQCLVNEYNSDIMSNNTILNVNASDKMKCLTVGSVGENT